MQTPTTGGGFYRGLFHEPLAGGGDADGAGETQGDGPAHPAERHQAMSWAQRLKRLFDLEIQTCEACGGKVRVIAA